MNVFNKIYLRDLIGKGIYIKLEPTVRKLLFSKFTFEDFDISYSLFHHYKSSDFSLSVPLDLIFDIITKLKLSESFLYNKILELKYGQRSKPFLNPTFPIIKDPYYWSILFSLFLDGSSDQWSSQKKKRIISPTYTSYSQEIMDTYIKLVKFKFGDFKSKVNYGSIRLPPILDIIFKNQHEVNSFNNKSNKIPKFILTKRFKEEIKKLNTLTKISILIRYLVDEGDKSEISLNPRSMNLTITSTTKDLIDILEFILLDLNLDYNIICKKRVNPNWNDAYQVQIKKGKKRDNLRRLNILVKKINEKYPLATLTKIQKSSIIGAANYKYKKNIPNFSQSKTIHFLIYKFLLAIPETTYTKINEMLISNGYNLNMNSILNVLKSMPLIRKKMGRQSMIIADKGKLMSYMPYTNKDIKNFRDYKKIIELYKYNKNISHISNETKVPWATVRDWVYGRTKPVILHGEWAEELSKRIN